LQAATTRTGGQTSLLIGENLMANIGRMKRLLHEQKVPRSKVPRPTSNRRCATPQKTSPPCWASTKRQSWKSQQRYSYACPRGPVAADFPPCFPLKTPVV